MYARVLHQLAGHIRDGAEKTSLLVSVAFFLLFILTGSFEGLSLIVVSLSAGLVAYGVFFVVGVVKLFLSYI